MAQLSPSSEDVRIYQCAVLYPYPVSQKDEQDVLKTVESIFDDAGAKQVAKDTWGRRGLAYNIGGFSEGNFVLYYYEIDPAKVKEVDTALRIAKGVLRHLLIKPPKNYEIAKYSEKYEQWKKEKQSAGEVAARVKEEKLQKQVADKAKRMVRRADDAKKKTVEEKPAMKPADIGAQLDKLISDDLSL